MSFWQYWQLLGSIPVKLKWKPFNVAITVAYTPTSEYTEKEMIFITH